MAREKTKKVKEEIEEQQGEFYGEEKTGGSQPHPESDDSADEPLEEVVGTKLDRGESFNIADEVEQDEEALRSKPQSEIEEERQKDEEES